MDLNHHRVGTGEPLLLVHGIGGRWQLWEPVIDRLAVEREVIAVDLPGFGSSPPARSDTPAGPKPLAGLLEDFLEGIGVELPHVAGNSLGGWIALEMAKRGSARSATALSPAGFYDDRGAAFLNVSLLTARRLARVVSRRAENLARSPTARRVLLAQYFAHPERIPASDAIEGLRDLANAPWLDETRRAIIAQRFDGGEQIVVPVTIAWAERDRLLLPAQARTAARLVPQARKVTLRGCGHVPTYDDPEQVAQVLLDGSTDRPS